MTFRGLIKLLHQALQFIMYSVACCFWHKSAGIKTNPSLHSWLSVASLIFFPHLFQICTSLEETKTVSFIYLFINPHQDGTKTSKTGKTAVWNKWLTQGSATYVFTPSLTSSQRVFLACPVSPPVDLSLCDIWSIIIVFTFNISKPSKYAFLIPYVGSLLIGDE